MRILLITLTLLLSACSSFNEDVIANNNIKDYIKKSNGNTTPEDGFVSININCFSNVEPYNENSDYNVSRNINFQNKITEEPETYYKIFRKNESKENDLSNEISVESIGGMQEILEKDEYYGYFFDFLFREVSNDKFLMDLKFIDKKIFKEYNDKSLSKTYFIDRKFYPTNRKPELLSKTFDEVCYMTVSW